ncbi:MAG: hypothetical protein ABJM36_15080 [Algibacter sp.]|uniref:hypothetical protein n=1 Tax=Algibacter sp. TaxID=1872428 RepID=UPI003298D502
MKPIKDLRIAILLCLTLGLAPFYPEPHLWGKLKWVFGGANGMGFKDWFDLLMHGFPFLFLLWLTALKLFKNSSS